MISTRRLDSPIIYTATKNESKDTGLIHKQMCAHSDLWPLETISHCHGECHDVRLFRFNSRREPVNFRSEERRVGKECPV